MLRKNKRIISILSAIVVSCSFFICDINKFTVKASAGTVNECGLAEETKDGTILHAFSWSFSTIRSKMKEIAECGYSAIQVSPIEDCLERGGRNNTWEWENTYQPREYKIGNYIVGTRDEFIALCKEAEDYGIKIIVDVVANHLSSDSPLNQPKYLHNTHRGIDDYNNRRSATQNDLSGMPDTNTQSHEFQSIIINFLNDCMDCGADGFRFDTTKHIELPSEVDGDFGGDFWPNIVNAIRSKKPDAFIYGEVLQNPADAYFEYSQYLGLTADWYGDKVRKAIKEHNFEAFNPMFYDSEGVSPDKLITYSETHDTFANYKEKSTDMNNWQVKKGYELVTARAQGTPLFLARPKNNGFTQVGDRMKLSGPVGVPQDDWNDSEVKMVNKFHNAMIGQSEYIRKLGPETIGIERGTEGMVVINLDGGFDGYIDTLMTSGSDYKDYVSGRDVSVSNGKVHVKIDSGKTAVICKKGVINEGSIEGKHHDEIKSNNKAFIKLPAGWKEPYAYIYEENGKGGASKQNAAWPGIKMTSIGNGIYEYDADTSFTKPLVIFNDGNNQYPAAGEKGLSLSGSMILNGTNWSVYTEGDKDIKDTKGSKVAYITLPEGWSQPYAYVYQESDGKVKQNTAWPGVKMTHVSGRVYRYNVDNSFTNPLVIFNDLNNQYPASGQKGLGLDSSMMYVNGSWTSYIE